MCSLTFYFLAYWHLLECGGVRAERDCQGRELNAIWYLDLTVILPIYIHRARQTGCFTSYFMAPAKCAKVMLATVFNFRTAIDLILHVIVTNPNQLQLISKTNKISIEYSPYKGGKWLLRLSSGRYAVKVTDLTNVAAVDLVKVADLRNATVSFTAPPRGGLRLASFFVCATRWR